LRRSTFTAVIATLVAGSAAAAFEAAPASGATTYYVSPTGSGSSGCSQAAPCALIATVAAAHSGDTVVLEGNDGSYGTSGSPISTEIDIPSGVTVTGDTSQAMPVIYTNNTSGLASSGVWVAGASSALDYLDIEWSGSGGIAAVFGVGTWNRVIVDATTGSGCTFDVGTTTVTDSVCAGGYAGVNDNWNIGSGTYNYVANIYNSTIVSPGIGMYLESESVHVDIAMQLENTIVRSTASISPTDLYIEDLGCPTAGAVTFSASYSNYATETDGPDVCNRSYTPPGTNNNQTTAPQFVNAAANNFAEASGSPTIGAGTNDTANDGTFDLAGALRDINGRTDIGAYEYVNAPIVATGTPSGLTTSGATVNATVNPNGAGSTYHVDYGTSASYGSASATQTLAAGASAQSIAVALSGLAASKTYHYRVVATNSAGTTDGPGETFTTAAPPAAAPPPAISAFTQSRSRWRDGSAGATFARAHKHKRTPVGTTFAVTLNEPATLTLSFTKMASGHSTKSGACVAPNKHNKHRPRCTLATAAGALSMSAHAGTNTITFDGVLPTGKLAPGSYTVSAGAQVPGKSAPAQTLSFTIVKH